MSYRTTLAADEDIIYLYVRGVTAFGTRQAERYFEGLFSALRFLPTILAWRGSAMNSIRRCAFIPIARI